MSSRAFANNPDYVAYERKLLRLNDLMAIGQGETEEADRLREEMYDLRQGLSDAESKRLEGLSADLYMLQDDEIFEQVDPAERTYEQLQPKLDLACLAGDWDEALSLLRRGPDFLTPSDLSRARASFYGKLGHFEAADLFLKHAQKLTPHQPLLPSLLRFGRH